MVQCFPGALKLSTVAVSWECKTSGIILPDKPSNIEQGVLQQIAEGDEASFRQLYARYYPQLRPFIWKYTGSALQTEDILQETFIRIWLNRDKLPEIENLSAWIFKVASREYLTMLRKQLVYEEKLATLHINMDKEGELAPLTPDDQAHLADIRRVIGEAVARLPEQRRRIYRMSRDEGIRIQEIADTLSITPRTVKNVLTISLKEIREHLAASGYTFMIPLFLFLKDY
jgi:RNA polymerase sigma-70 factor (ECF subfamily)